MFSSAACYTNQERSWHLEHNAQQNMYHLNSSGNLPGEFKAIYDKLKEQQDEAGGQKTHAPPLRVEVRGKRVKPAHSTVGLRQEYRNGDIEIFNAHPESLQEDLQKAFGQSAA